jgi:hypothetical protein
VQVINEGFPAKGLREQPEGVTRFQGNDILYPHQFPDQRSLLAYNHPPTVMMAVAKCDENVGGELFVCYHLHELLPDLLFPGQILHFFKRSLEAH